VAVILSIFIVVCWLSFITILIFARSPIFSKVIVGSLNDWHKERQFRILNEKKEELRVKVIRSAIGRVVGVKELLVGDVALLEPGEIVPCDGVFISGHNIRCDESGVTGGPDAVKKVGYNEYVALREQAKREGAGTHEPEASVPNDHADCFVVSGSKVLEGHGKYVVIAVGQKRFNCRIMMGMSIWGFSTISGHWLTASFAALQRNLDPAPLQEKLKDLVELIKIGGGTVLTICAALTIRSLVQSGTGEPER
jgi:Ca2+-transporting ATPase